VYLWENRAAAEAWFTKERQEMLADKFGAKPEIIFFDTHVVVDNQRGETRVNGKPLPDIQAAELASGCKRQLFQFCLKV
ncbi:MAG: hypothetical protein VXA00_02780, partial [Rhodospirillales bacterium]